MVHMVMLLGMDRIYLYEKRENRFVRQYIEGRMDFPFDLNHSGTSAQRLLEALANELNIDRVSELEFTVIDNRDALCTEVVHRAFKEHIVETIELPKVLMTVMKRLQREKKLHIQEYGVDFDGVHYMLSEGKLCSGPFDLLAYHLDEDALVNMWE